MFTYRGYSAPGGMRAGFEYYRALSDDIKQNKEYSRVKLPMPVLALGGKCSFGTAALDSMRLLATDVRGSIVPDSGHWIPEEQPHFLVDQLFKLLSDDDEKSDEEGDEDKQEERTAEITTTTINTVSLRKLVPEHWKAAL
jgi:hypothetical protein